MKLSCNVAGWDRGIRVIMGIVLIVLGFIGVLSGTLAVIGYVIGAILLVTGITTFCPACKLFVIKTCKS